MNRSGTKLSFIKQLWPFVRPYRGRIAVAAVCLLVAAGLVLGIGQGLRVVIDKGFANADASFLNHALAAMFAVTSILAVATFGRYYMITWLGERIAADMREKLFSHLLKLDIEFYETTRTGDLTARVTNDTLILQNTIGSTSSMALRHSLILIGGMIALLLTSAKLTAIVFLVVPLVVAPMAIFRRRLRGLARQTQDELANVSAETNEILGALRTVQAFTNEPLAAGKFNRQNELAFSVTKARFTVRAYLTGLIIFLVFGAIGVILWIGGHDVIDGTITGGALSAFIFYAVMVASAVAALSEVMADIERANGATSRIFELLSLRPAIRSPETPRMLPQPIKGDVVFDKVAFTYPSVVNKPVLQDIAFSASAGEKVALVGPSGAGKTTVFNLLLRFYDASHGHITIDGIPVDAMTLEDLRHTIALVPQDPVLFSGTIRDNIKFGRPGASEQEIITAATQAQAWEFIERQSEGLDTIVGERGVRLSGGQRQRLAIARTLLRNPPILLLDEATSALDAASEHLVQKALDVAMQGRTTLIIAHRLATVRAADRILVLDQGRIVDQGRHDDLVAKGGLYAELARLQFQS